MDKIAVLIPCYNEAKTVKKVIEDFKKELPEATIYVYDNNSTDGTDKIAIEAGAIVRYEKKQGKGNVIRTMFGEIDAECYIIVDGDDTYPAENARQMLDYILKDKVDMVIGDRLSSNYFTENKRKFHNFGNMLVRGLINMLYKSDIRDVMTGYRALGHDFVKHFTVLSNGFEVETEMTMYALDQNLLTKNVIIEYRDRPNGSKSKLHTYKDGCKVVKTIFMLHKNYKPLSFFSIVSLLLVLIGMCFLLPVLIDYVKTGLIHKMIPFVVSIIFFIIAIQLFFYGSISKVITKKNHKNK